MISKIINFNKNLVDNITILDYIKEINKISYNIDINLINFFMNLIDKDVCYIHHEELYKYGIVKYNDIIEVEKLFKKYNFIENKDYTIRKVLIQLITKNKYINEYYLHPKAFKICLIYSNIEYIRYYLILEEYIKYYNDYQNKIIYKFSKL